MKVLSGEISQTVWADETDVPKPIRFEASETWTASVASTPASAASRASSVDWITLLFDGIEQYTGSAGTFTMTIELNENYTGARRSATITLRCGDTIITITIIQDGKTEDGVIPEDPTNPPPQPPEPFVPARFVSAIVTKWNDDGDEGTATITFTYDSQGRIVGFEEVWDGAAPDTGEYIWEPGKVSYGRDDELDVLLLNSRGWGETYTTTNGDPGPTYLAYDRNDRLTSVTWGEEDGDGGLFECVWDAAGNMIEITMEEDYQLATYTTHPNNVSIDLNHFVYGMYIDIWGPQLHWTNVLGKRSANLIATYREKNDESDYTINFTYEFDEDGFVTKITETGTRDTDVYEIYYTDGPQPEPAPELIRRIDITIDDEDDGTSTGTMAFTYDGQYRVSKIETVMSSSIETESSTYDFTWASNKVTIDYVFDTEGDHDEQATEFTLNSKGYATQTTTSFPNDDDWDPETIAMTYRTDDRLEKTTYVGNESSFDMAICTWNSAGNLSSISNEDNDGVITLAYSSSPNDSNLDLNWLLVGGSEFDFDLMEAENMGGTVDLFGVRSPKLVSTHTDDDGEVASWSYQFNGNGAIVKAIRTFRGDTWTYDFSY